MKNQASIREIFAGNLRENRRKCGFSQEKLAEKTGITTQYLAMIEIARKFPSAEVIERLSSAMGLKIYELFLTEHSPREELELLRKEIICEMKQVFDESLLNVFSEREEPRPNKTTAAGYGQKKKTKRG